MVQLEFPQLRQVGGPFSIGHGLVGRFDHNLDLASRQKIGTAAVEHAVCPFRVARGFDVDLDTANPGRQGYIYVERRTLSICRLDGVTESLCDRRQIQHESVRAGSLHRDDFLETVIPTNPQPHLLGQVAPRGLNFQQGSDAGYGNCRD